MSTNKENEVLEEKQNNDSIIKPIIIIIFILSFIYSNMLMYNKITLSLGNQWSSRCSLANYSAEERHKCLEKENAKLEKARLFAKKNQESSKFFGTIFLLAAIISTIVSRKQKLALRWTVLSVITILFSIYILLI